jgi:non-ribosomal peptide synthetase component F
MAASLQARGIGVGSLVAIYLEKSCGLFAAILGVLKAGAGYVPLDPAFPVGRVQSILEDANITTVISDGHLAEALAGEIASEVMVLRDELSRGPQSSLLRRPETVTPNDVCYVIYTSGSTGRPKGVVIEHRQAVNFVRSLRTVYELTPQDRVYQGFSIAFDASVNLHKITYFSTVPSFLALIKADLPTVRLLVVGGEPCSAELVQRWVTPSRRMMNTYGPTEATVVATAVYCVPGETVTIGTALPGYVVHVFDEHLRPVEPGGRGELYIGGAGVARGYLNRPELTAERFIRIPATDTGSAPERLYRTRDLVRLTEDGGVEFIGRADQQIKIRGFRIELTEIEAVLMEHPSIQAAAVKAPRRVPCTSLVVSTSCND